ncbi:hypothetical protein B0T16DRAFT_442392 [Cercophora newfieldiana]|uniref:Uncharacterized protein n=1 Tax=Cercophora newfieldiana TaxID=92897 RepID=A0AA39YSF0_9PEZI|nr:hypothetical protein B0T16DRAFT_442392 [Cercophora newfieldiana]
MKPVEGATSWLNLPGRAAAIGVSQPRMIRNVVRKAPPQAHNSDCTYFARETCPILVLRGLPCFCRGAQLDHGGDHCVSIEQIGKMAESDSNPYLRFANGEASAVRFKVDNTTRRKWCELIGEVTKHAVCYRGREHKRNNDGAHGFDTSGRYSVDAPEQEGLENGTQEKEATERDDQPTDTIMEDMLETIPPAFENSITYLTWRPHSGIPNWVMGLLKQPPETIEENRGDPSFHKFGLLPGELQDEVYAACVDPVDIFAGRFSTRGRWTVLTPRTWADLPLLHVCRRSRTRMIDQFGIPDRGNVPIDTSGDVLSFAPFYDSYYLAAGADTSLPWITLSDEFMDGIISRVQHMKFVLEVDQSSPQLWTFILRLGYGNRRYAI